MASFLSALFSSGRPERELLVDVLLMIALVDGALTQRERDALSHLVAKHKALRGTRWNDVLERAQTLAEDAPLFFDARDEVSRRLTDPDHRRLAITLAAEVAAGGGAMAEEEHAILLTLANGFGIPDEEAKEIIKATAGRDDVTFVRVAFNDPRTDGGPSLFDSIERARSPTELRALLFKPRAIRSVITLEAAGGTIEQIGPRLPIGLHQLRIDAEITQGPKRWLVRCIAPQETLHDDEHHVFRMLLEQVDASTCVVFAHTGELAPADAAFLESLDPSGVAIVTVT